MHTLSDIVSRLESGDEFTVFAGEFIVDDVIDCDARPMVRVRKKSVGGYMDRTYRLEWADPTDEDDETLVIKTKYKSHWSEWSTFAPETVNLAKPMLVTDGGVSSTGTENLRKETREALVYRSSLARRTAGGVLSPRMLAEVRGGMSYGTIPASVIQSSNTYKFCVEGLRMSRVFPQSTLDSLDRTRLSFQKGISVRDSDGGSR